MAASMENLSKAEADHPLRYRDRVTLMRQMIMVRNSMTFRA